MAELRLTGRQRAWHAAVLVVAGVALLLQTGVVVARDESLVNLVSYFTIQSNLLVFASSAVLARGLEPDAAWWRLLRLAALTGITVTFVVFALLIGPRTPFAWRDLWFVGWPAAWLAYTLVRGAVSSPGFMFPGEKRHSYPYGFIDVDDSPTPVA